MATESLFDRFLALPRAMRWLVGAVGFTLLFLVWDESIGQMSRDWSAKADRIETQLAEIRDAAALNDTLRRVDDVIVAIGPVELPGNENDGRSALDRAVNDVLREHSVSDPSFDLGASASQVPTALSAGIVDGRERLRRINGELRFESSPETAIAVIAALESRPEIEGISAVRLVVAGNRTLSVRLTLEAWARGERRRRA